jgi:hypothetical protein
MSSQKTTSNGNGKEDTSNSGKFGTTESPKCLAERANGLKPKTHKGLPLLTREEFQNLYKTQSTDGVVRTFNFQGYVEDVNAVGEIGYRDVLATNGLRNGIHVGIDGTFNYHDGMRELKDPSEIGEYVVYVTVPPEAQKKERVICESDSCYSVQQKREQERFRLKFMEQEAWEKSVAEEIEEDQNREGWIVVRLSIDPKEDNQARKKVEIISLAITSYIEGNKPLEGLQEFILNVGIYLADHRLPHDAFRGNRIADIIKRIGQ